MDDQQCNMRPVTIHSVPIKDNLACHPLTRGLVIQYKGQKRTFKTGFVQFSRPADKERIQNKNIEIYLIIIIIKYSLMVKTVDFFRTQKYYCNRPKI